MANLTKNITNQIGDYVYLRYQNYLYREFANGGNPSTIAHNQKISVLNYFESQRASLTSKGALTGLQNRVNSLWGQGNLIEGNKSINTSQLASTVFNEAQKRVNSITRNPSWIVMSDQSLKVESISGLRLSSRVFQQIRTDENLRNFFLNFQDHINNTYYTKAQILSQVENITRLINSEGLAGLNSGNSTQLKAVLKRIEEAASQTMYVARQFSSENTISASTDLTRLVDSSVGGLARIRASSLTKVWDTGNSRYDGLNWMEAMNQIRRDVLIGTLTRETEVYSEGVMAAYLNAIESAATGSYQDVLRAISEGVKNAGAPGQGQVTVDIQNIADLDWGSNSNWVNKGGPTKDVVDFTAIFHGDEFNISQKVTSLADRTHPTIHFRKGSNILALVQEHGVFMNHYLNTYPPRKGDKAGFKQTPENVRAVMKEAFLATILVQAIGGGVLKTYSNGTLGKNATVDFVLIVDEQTSPPTPRLWYIYDIIFRALQDSNRLIDIQFSDKGDWPNEFYGSSRLNSSDSVVRIRNLVSKLKQAKYEVSINKEVFNG